MQTLEFESAICTTKEQSERLLALGLKKETADCYLFEYDKEKYKVIAESWLDLIADKKYYSQYKDVCFPAWSLHRLLILIPKEVNIDGFKFPLRSDAIMRLEDADYMYERLTGIIERVIEQGYFNKDYLEDKK